MIEKDTHNYLRICFPAHYCCSFYDDASLSFPQPDKVIRKRLADAAVEYKRLYQIESGLGAADNEAEAEDKNVAISNQ